MYTKLFPQLYKFCMVVQFFKHFPCGRWHLLMGSSFESNLPQQFGRPGSRVESVDRDPISAFCNISLRPRNIVIILHRSHPFPSCHSQSRKVCLVISCPSFTLHRRFTLTHHPWDMHLFLGFKRLDVGTICEVSPEDPGILSKEVIQEAIFWDFGLGLSSRHFQIPTFNPTSIYLMTIAY